MTKSVQLDLWHEDDLTVLRTEGDVTWVCRCSCNTERECNKDDNHIVDMEVHET